MLYRECAATPALTGIVDCVWTLDGDARELADAQPVLPESPKSFFIWAIHSSASTPAVLKSGSRE
jgi:hypothetical protein